MLIASSKAISSAVVAADGVLCERGLRNGLLYKAQSSPIKRPCDAVLLYPIPVDSYYIYTACIILPAFPSSFLSQAKPSQRQQLVLPIKKNRLTAHSKTRCSFKISCTEFHCYVRRSFAICTILRSRLRLSRVFSKASSVSAREVTCAIGQ